MKLAASAREEPEPGAVFRCRIPLDAPNSGRLGEYSAKDSTRGQATEGSLDDVVVSPERTDGSARR